MTNKEILAQRIAALREEAKVTRQKAADDLGVTRAALEFYEKGKRTPDVGMIARLAAYYGVSTDYLLGVVDFRNPENEKPAAELHLSEKTIELLQTNDGDFAKIIDMILSHHSVLTIHLLQSIQAYIESERMTDKYLSEKVYHDATGGFPWEEFKKTPMGKDIFSNYHQIHKISAYDKATLALKAILEELESESRGKEVFTHPVTEEAIRGA